MKVQLRHVFIGLFAKRFSQLIIVIIMAGVTGLEPATYRVTGDRSNQTELHPPFNFFWWAVKDSNL